MNKKLAAWIALGLIAVVAALLLATTNEVTKDVIAQQNVAATQEAWQTLVPGAEFPEGVAAAESEAGVPEAYVYEGVGDDGGAVGYVAQQVVQGYGGEIQIIVGSDPEGTITGINVGGANFAETAGLGAKAKDAAFTDQFADQTAPLTVGEEIDAITAATITSNAVVRGVNAAMENIAEVAGFTIESEAAEAGEIGDGRYAATAKGFAGPVYVEIQLDDSDTITEIVIGDDQFAETAGYGQKALEPDFYEQFIGKTGQLTLGEDIDAISGATITSQAVVDAVNTAMLYATDPDAAAAAASEEDTFELPEVPDTAITETASSKGFEGPVAATITVDPDTRELLRVEFGDDQFAETEGFGSKVKEEDFWHQFIGKTMPIEEGEVDTISGATISSNAAIEAVNKAYYKLYPDEDPGEAEEETAEVVADDGATANSATASSKGFGGPVAAAIEVDDDNVVTSVEFGDDNWAETDGIGSQIQEDAFVTQFVGKTLPLADGDIDTISGATVTSEAAIAAVNKALEKIEAARGEGDNAEETTTEAANATASSDDGVTANSASASSKGFGGPVAAAIEVDDNNVITSVEFGDDNWAETDGIGSKIKEDDFVSLFAGKTLPLADGDIDTISGATVTSEAAIAAVNKAFEKIEAARGEGENAEETTEAATATASTDDGVTANSASASSKGFGGPVAATIEVDDNNAITTVEFGDDNWAETDGIGSKIKEDDFVSQFIGKTLPLADGDIDTISGATVTSEAAIAAVNKAFDKIEAAGGEGDSAEEASEEVTAAATAETEPTAAPADTAKASPTVAATASETVTAKASAEGKNGPVMAELTVDADNTITALAFGDDDWAETDGIGSKILEEDFIAQFIGKRVPLSEDDIDIVTGATISSEAAIAAVNNAFEQVQLDRDDGAPGVSELRTASGSAEGKNGPVTVEISVDAEGHLAGLSIDEETFAETDGLGTRVLRPEYTEAFLGRQLPIEAEEADIISGATISSQAVIDAINSAFETLSAEDESAQ